MPSSWTDQFQIGHFVCIGSPKAENGGDDGHEPSQENGPGQQWKVEKSENNHFILDSFSFCHAQGPSDGNANTSNLTIEKKVYIQLYRIERRRR